MKQMLSTIVLVLVAAAGWAQTKVWNEVVTGYANTPVIGVKKVAMYGDRTEISMHIDFRRGQRIAIAPNTVVRADGKDYGVKEATVLKLGERFTMPEDTLDFVLTFEPVPTTTKVLDLMEPNGWLVTNIHSVDDLPESLDDTYWRDETTGDWLIGFAPKHVIYNNNVWDIVKRTEKKGGYEMTLGDGTTIKVSKMKKGLRTITIGNVGAGPVPARNLSVVCSPIVRHTLPDYPMRDERTGFTDNGYDATDSVTIIGWLKDMPEQAWQRGREFQVGFENIIADKQESAFAKMDSIGRFTLRMPLLNTSQVFLDWGRTTKSTVLEPGKTYFFLNDFKTGHTLWMGDDVRVQNELLAYPHAWPNDRIEHEDEGKVSAMEFKALTDSTRAANMAKLQACGKEHPTLSQRYIDYVSGYYLTAQGESMMQARFSIPARKLPQEYMDYVGQELWSKAVRPYTLYRDFGTFLRDYLDQLHDSHQRNTGAETVETIRKLEREGIATLTADEQEALNVYVPMLNELEAKLQKAQGGDVIDSLVDAFNTHPTVEKVYNLFNRIGDPIRNELATTELRENLVIIDSVGCDRNLRDIYLARYLYKQIDITRKPLEPALLAYAEQNVQMPAALSTLKSLNDKYLAINQQDITKSPSLKTADDVANMSDGEQMLRKICEPYKGKLILLDVWGTWCGPCKQMLSHSQEEYERLKDFDLVYLYLCNRSSDESWKNVIKEYNVLGDNVVHYNLPEDQQTAIEHFLHVQHFPTYRLIDRDGNVLDVNADPHDLEGLARLLEQMKQ